MTLCLRLDGASAEERHFIVEAPTYSGESKILIVLHGTFNSVGSDDPLYPATYFEDQDQVPLEGIRNGNVVVHLAAQLVTGPDGASAYCWGAGDDRLSSGPACTAPVDGADGRFVAAAIAYGALRPRRVVGA